MGLKIFTILVFAEICEFFWTAAQYDTAQSQSPHSIILRGVNIHFLKLLHRPLKRQCHETFFIFILPESNPFGSLINSLKWFCWKTLFCKDIHEKRDSAQCDTAPSQEIEMSENPKLSITARSRTLCSVKLRRVKKFYLFLKTYISMTFSIYVMIFWKNSKIFWNPKMANAAPSPTPCSVILRRVGLWAV